MDEIKRKARELLAAEYEKEGILNAVDPIMSAVDRAAVAAIAVALRSAQVPDGVAWRDQYRIQTAMRYMDNAPRLTLDEAYRMADHDIRGLEQDARRRCEGHLPFV